MKFFFLFLFLISTANLLGQNPVVRDIKSFGAKGDGKTNDHEAFQRAAAFFNQRGGYGKLVISKGIYIVGKQIHNQDIKTRNLFTGQDLLHFTKVKHLSIEGVNQPLIQYKDSLRFGSFVPATGEPYKNSGNFFKPDYAAVIRNAIELTDCQNIVISNLELDGNNRAMILGGQWGDIGRQLPHSGLWIINSINVTVTNLNVHHFGLDGIALSNATSNRKVKDGIVISNCRFEYNARQGLSWVGGNDLTVTKSSFNHTGKGKFSSAPTAGVDIEAEVATVSGGRFIDCQFLNNGGCGIVADSGPSSDCTFVRCLFWGVDQWSAWVRKPAFRFDSCTFHGSFVHGFAAENDHDATKFSNCFFEDQPYNGKGPYGGFLIESNYAKRMRFDNCTFKANNKALAWLSAVPNSKSEERYQFIRCKLYYKGETVWLNDNIFCRETSYKITNPKTMKVSSFYVDGNGNLTKR